MAKMFDKISAHFGKIVARFAETRLIRVRQNREWTDTEIEELPAMQERKNKALLAKKQSRFNAKLQKAAFAACDKDEYFRDVYDKKLRRFDVRQFMSYRAAYHAAARAIFATADGNCDAALAAMNERIAKLEGKRAEFVVKLDKARSEFLSKNPSADSAEYDRLRAEYEKQYDEYAAELERKSESYIAARTAKLQAKSEKYAQKERALKAKVISDVQLPPDVLLRVEGLKMYFGGLKAVDDLTFDVKNGEIFGLIGPNGAGKTTVFNCITRFYNATGGNMYFRNRDDDNVDLRRFKVHDVILEGISRTFQNVELVREISVLENLLVACTRNYRSNFFVQALGIPTVKKEDNILKSKAMRILQFMGLESYATWPAMGLPYGILKKVEIARALMADPKLIVLDEPAAGLNNTETTQLSQLILRIRDEFRCSVLLVEHDMSLVMSICDRICAISFGKMLALGTPAEIQSDKQVQEAYLGVSEDAPTGDTQTPESPVSAGEPETAESADAVDKTAANAPTDVAQSETTETAAAETKAEPVKTAKPKAKSAAKKPSAKPAGKKEDA